MNYEFEHYYNQRPPLFNEGDVRDYEFDCKFTASKEWEKLSLRNDLLMTKIKRKENNKIGFSVKKLSKREIKYYQAKKRKR